MAITYQRNTWETGKVITAKALNDIETGIVSIVEKLNDMDGQVTSQALTVEDNASIKGTATVTGKATFNGPVEIKGATTISGATTINNDITVSTNQHIILLESSSESPNESNYVITKGYVDGEVTTINNAIADINQTGITSTNTGITSTGHIGDELSITLNPATTSALGGIKVGQNLSIDAETGELNATDTTYSMASASVDGLMSKAHFSKLNGLSIKTANTSAVEPDNNGLITLNSIVDGINVYGVAQSFSSGIVNIKGVITGIKLDENTTISPSSTAENGIIDISAKANTASPSFTGIASFGDNIKIKSSDHTITIGSAVLSETQLNSLYSILPQNNIQDGEYTLKLSKSTVDDEPVFTYSWVSISQQESGGEGS